MRIRLQAGQPNRSAAASRIGPHLEAAEMRMRDQLERLQVEGLGW